MIGAIIGDIAGSVYEFDNIKSKEFPLYNDECCYTDDSLMTIAVAQALDESKNDFSGFTQAVIASMRKLGRKYPCPMGGYGGGFYRWLMSEEPKPYFSYGNGSAMRASACGEIAQTLEQAIELGKMSAEVTHNHPEGIKGAQALAAAVFMASHGKTKEEIRSCIADNFYTLDKTIEEIRPSYHFECSCQQTVPQAITAFLESTSFEDALRTAVSLGGDCDTLTDITCAIAWPYYALRGMDECMMTLMDRALAILPCELSRFVSRWETEHGFCKQTGNDITELVFILDKSGSMSGLEDDTIGGFNSLIQKQKSESGRAIVSTVLFSSSSTVLHDRVDINAVEPMSRSTYIPSGSTALLDAIGGAIHHIGNVHKYARKEDVPSKTLFIITTDGMENASRVYDSDKVKQLIKHQQEKYGWEFLFLGANIDAVETAARFGISEDRAVEYKCDSEGVQLNYEVVNQAVRSLRADGCLPKSWNKRIKEDLAKRK